MRAAGGLLLLLLGACPDEPTGDCSPLLTDCQPLYEPNFEQVYANTIARSCGVGGGSCHSAEGAKGGLAFADIDSSHDQLLQETVVPGDASCSPLMARLNTDDSLLLMPPGRALSLEERCAVAAWIDRGANR